MPLLSNLDSSTFNYFNSECPFQGSSPSKIEWDILTFLGVVQRHGIDFLPVTWQPALETIGRGATAEIRQALVYSQTAFAFKQTPPSRLNENESATFQALIAEVLVLGHPLIRNHRQITTLEGISWDIIDGGTSILPVLVFEKAPHGSLSQFMTHDLGRRLCFSDRLKLCADIANAVAQMHVNKVIHGDIKPDNVLIFNHSPEGYFGKVSDFGYSTWFAGDDELIKLPISQPWCAPEWHHRGFNVSDAMKMDAYSFGMLSLWLLFYSSVGSSISLFHDKIWPLDPAKRLSVALEIVASTPNVFKKQRRNLKNFFACTLEPKPAHRKSDFIYLLRLLGQRENPFPVSREQLHSPYEPNYDNLPQAPSIALWADEFRVTDSMAQLYQFDYHVRSHIVKSLVHKHAMSIADSSDLVPQNSAVQLALCYEVGFGVQRDTEQASKILLQAPQHREEIDGEICKLKGESGKLRFQQGMFEDLRRHGLCTPFNTLQNYYGHQHLNELESVHRKEVVDLQSVLGSRCDMVQTLNLKLSEILSMQSRWQEAEDLQRQVLGVRSRVLGESHPDTLTILDNLVSIYQHQHRWKSAQKLSSQVTRIRMEALRDQDPRSLKSLDDLIILYLNEARWKAAGAPGAGLGKTKKAPNLHPDMLATVANVASVCWNRGRWKRASSLEESINVISNRLFEDGGPISLMSRVTLAWIHLNLLEVQKAEQLLTQVIEEKKKMAGNERLDMISSISHLSMVYCMKGQWEKALKLAKQIADHRMGTLGEKHLITHTSVADVASIFWILEQWEHTENLQSDVIQRARKALGNDHPFTNTVKHDLLLTYQSQGKWREWEELSEQVVEMNATASGNDKDPETLLNMINLASVYQMRGRWNSARKLQAQKRKFEEELKDREDEYEETLNCINILASMYQVLGDFERVGELDNKLVEIREKVLGDEESDTFTRLKDIAASLRNQGQWQKTKELETHMSLMMQEVAELGTLTFRPGERSSLPKCYHKGRWKDVEQVEMRAVEESKKSFGDDDPRTLRDMADLALTQLIHGRFEEAESLQRHIVASYRRRIGDEEPITLKSMQDLMSTCRHHGSRDEADELHRQVKEITKTKEKNFPAALTTAGNLTLICRPRNHWKRAEMAQLWIMKHFQNSLGLEHQYTISSMTRLASTYASQGRWIEAEGLQMTVVERNQRILGDEHPHTLLSMEDLALTYWHQGRWKRTEDLELQIMKANNDVLGNDHVETIKSVSKLAITYRNQGRFAKAIELQSHVLGIREKLLGKRHPETSRSMIDLASMHWGQNQLDVVRDLLTQALDMRYTELDSDGSETLEVMDLLITTHLKLVQKEEAEKLAANVMEIKRERLGNEHSSTIKTSSNLASIYQAQKRWEEATTLHSQILDTQKRVLGEKDPKTLAAMRNLAVVYFDQGLWSEAQELQDKALHIGKEELGEEHPLCIKLANDLLSTYRHQGCQEKLERLDEDSKRTIEKSSRAEYPDLLANMAGVALKAWDQGNWDDAIKLSSQVVEIERTRFPEKQYSVSNMANLASSYWDEHRYEEAELVQSMVVERSKKARESDDPNHLTSLRNSVSVYRALKRFREAEEQATKVIEIGRKFGGNKYPGILDDMRALALIYRDQERWEDGDELFNQIIELKKEMPVDEGPGGAMQSSMTTSGTEKEWRIENDDMTARWYLG